MSDDPTLTAGKKGFASAVLTNKANIRMNTKFSKATKILSLLLFMGLLIWTAVAIPYGDERAIRSDGVGYNIWVHGFKDLNCSFWGYHEYFPHGIVHADPAQQKAYMKYPPGVGMLQFLLGGFLMDSDLRKTGVISSFDHALVLWIGVVLLFLTAVISYKTLMLCGVNYVRCIMATGAFLFGTGLFHYGTSEPSMSHVYGAFGVSLALYIVIKNNIRRTWSLMSLCLFGALSFWLFMVRNTNGALTLGIMLLALTRYIPETCPGKADPSNTQTGVTLKNLNWNVVVSWAVGTAFATLFLMLYISYATGKIGLSTYGPETFIAFGKNVWGVLLSYERGLIPYHPLFLFTIIFAVLISRNLVTYIFVFLVVLFVFVYGSWGSWYLGIGFGHRGFIEIAPIGALVLGLCLEKIAKTKWTLPIVLAIFVCCFITSKLMWAYWTERYTLEGVTGRLYWSTISPAPKLTLRKVRKGQKIQFNTHGFVGNYLAENGLSYLESWGRWSNSSHASMVFKVAGTVTSLQLRAGAFITPEHPHQRVTVSVNGIIALETILTKNSDNILTIDIPSHIQEELVTNGTLRIEFSLPDFTSPKQLGLSEDFRKLAIGLNEIEFN